MKSLVGKAPLISEARSKQAYKLWAEQTERMRRISSENMKKTHTKEANEKRRRTVTSDEYRAKKALEGQNKI